MGGGRVSRIGLGCSQVGSFGNPDSLDRSRALMRLALDLGVNHFDTADIYGQGDSERAVGQAIKGRRDEAFLVTKFGKTFSAKMRLLRPLKPLLKPVLRARGSGGSVAAQRSGVMREDFRPVHLTRALDASLRRMGLDVVDAVLLHSPPLAVLADPAVGEVMATILASGKARYVGVSVDDRAGLEAALALPACSLLQIPYDLMGALDEPAVAPRLAERPRFVFAREIIRLQPDRRPSEAVALALARPRLTGIIVGTRQPVHLKALAAALS
jgi:aryl-alcohol dehydrogenase-like predicted oxidoreductase